MGADDSSEPPTVTASLKSGLVVTIRPLRPSDREMLAAAIRGLDPRSIYTRLFSHHKGLTEAELDRIMRTDPDREVVLVATVGAGATERIIGEARYAVTREAPVRVAEVAFTVEEDFQGRGLAGRLLRELADAARAGGIQRFAADVLVHNISMLRVFERFGAPLQKRFDDGEVHVEFDLPTAARTNPPAC